MRVDAYLVCPHYGQPYGQGGQRIKHGGAPLGMACINGMIKSKGYRTRFIDLDFSDLSEAELIEQVVTDRPRVVGLTAVTTQIMSAVRIAQAIKLAAPEVTTVLGGPHPSALPELTASYPGVDLVISGEGELPVLDLLEGRPYDEIPGLTWTDNGVVRSNPRGPLIADLDAMPLPDYAGLNVQLYGLILQHDTFNGPIMPVMGGRGCPYRCTFCASKVVARRNCRFLSPARFVDHIEDLVDRHGIRDFSFSDETFVLNKRRVREICDEIQRRQLDIRWACLTRVNTVDVQILQTMKQAGCRLIETGIESGDQDILDRIGKGIKKAQVREACEIITQTGIRVNGCFILGLPYETPETVRRTIDFAKELPLTYAQFAMLVPLPGSAVWETALDGEVVRMHASTWDDFSRYTYPMVESDALSREQLHTLHRKALREFYYRPKRVAKWLLTINSRKKLKSLRDMVVAFAQVTRAKRRPGNAQQVPRVTHANVERLIGSLGQAGRQPAPGRHTQSPAPYAGNHEHVARESAWPALVS